ncbi:MAG: cysteine protease [Chitinophagaceae bacterium]|nr:cysteine protease [Chitinophagaceae bacterium]
MKKLYITAFVFIFLFGKTFSQGLIFDSAQFASRTSVKITRGALPKVYSLKKFTPIGFPQVGSTCVAQSFATARTILAAKSLGWIDKQKITSLYFSPYYIYYRNKMVGDVNCNYGLNVEDAAKDVLKNGFAPIAEVEYPNYYPFTSQALCIEKSGTDYPPSMQEDEDIAANYKIDEIYTVTTIQQLKTALAAGMPVAVILFPPSSFSTVKTDLWTPLPTEILNKNIMAHAVLAIGYDDTKYGGCIEIMNSWGDTWGNKGFVSLKYKDYAKFFVGGYAFYMKDKKPAIKDNVPEKKDNIPSRKTIDSSPTYRGTVTPTTINVRRGYGNSTIKFNNGELLKSFKK